MRTHSRTGSQGVATQQAESSPDEEKGLEVKEEHKPADEALRLVHHHAGYLRIRAAAFLHAGEDSPAVKAARAAAEGARGVRSWNLSPKTGSAVIEYEPGQVEADDLLKRIAASAGFQGVQVATRHKVNRQEVVSKFLDQVQSVNHVVSQMTGGRADLRELGPVALAAISVVSFIVNDQRGRLPQWSSALYHSYRVFMHWHRPEIRTRERTGRQEEELAISREEDVDAL
jgi:hypothetical protein